MWPWRRSLGARGERAAARFLRRAGFRILHKNYRCPLGELDLVALDGDAVVFVEVKTRRQDDDADPFDNIHAHKRSQLAKVARHWLTQHRYPDRPYRFDAVAVVLDGRQARVEHVVDAFHPPA